ncbi:hypothetical protein DFA_01613 [Cavenderia fasciculata]|uniref:TLC domain-containing protein n=1 Tax=Cavenderia fasciculata TaxID=261658 RepID=F4PTQ7_CACFS|nr:uncharacterized protein DFA_01613 [Cavenderia fasciculata]EGG21727.1 hypothetical protein DFA_01613 [Cavenderia fasciculata]|eukprot:XP_004359577.1 hypothetical protein DFA_01613 [Cavenderia fasciculata]
MNSSTTTMEMFYPPLKLNFNVTSDDPLLSTNNFLSLDNSYLFAKSQQFQQQLYSLTHWDYHYFQDGDNFLTNNFGLKSIPLNNIDVIKCISYFFFLPMIAYYAISIGFLKLSPYILSEESQLKVHELAKTKKYHEIVQRLIRSLYVLYLFYHFWKNVMSFHKDEIDPYFIAAAYAIYHMADTCILFFYQSKHIDMYLHHACAVISLSIMVFGVNKGLYPILMSGCVDILSVFSFFLFAMKSFGKSYNYFYVFCLAMSNVIILFYRAPIHIHLLQHLYNGNFPGGILWCIPNIIILLLDAKWFHSIFKSLIYSIKSIQKIKSN